MNTELLFANLDKVHTTELGLQRIKQNIDLKTNCISDWCRSCIIDKKSSISKKGKNWYVNTGTCIITINSTSFTIITAHKIKK